VARPDKLLERILSGKSDRNIPFMALRNLLLRMGFRERVAGSHHLFDLPGIEDKINLQRDGHEAKAYQVRQVRRILWKHWKRLDT
jgi:hypothetical protein